MMASVCGVLRQPGKGEIAALAPCILGPRRPLSVASWIVSAPSTMPAAGPVACGGEISVGRSVILRGKKLVCKGQICSDCWRQLTVFCFITAKAKNVNNTGDRMIAAGCYNQCRLLTSSLTCSACDFSLPEKQYDMH